MNKTDIEYVDFTWNPVTGCLRGCGYCYARRLAEKRLKHLYPNGFAPTFWSKRLNEPGKVKKPSRILVCSMGDLFGEGVEEEWIDAVLSVIWDNPQHTFMLLTKNPTEMGLWGMPDNVWAGVTLEGTGTTGELHRQLAFWQMVDASVRFVSCEPLLGEVVIKGYPDWVIIGAQTGPGSIAPERRWVERLIDEARAVGAAVFLKDNLKWADDPLQAERIQEFPHEARGASDAQDQNEVIR